MTNNNKSIKVFISYSHDSPEQMDRVLGLANRLRRGGIDCLIDQYEMSPREGWPLWTMNQIEEARFVLVICTETYHRRVRGKEEPGIGLGATWEGAILTQALYESQSNNDKFIPVLFSAKDSPHIPIYLRRVTHYVLDDGYEDLYRHLTNQPKYLKPAVGKLRSLPPLDRKEDFLPVNKKPSPPTKTQSRRRAILIIGALGGVAALALILLWWLIPRQPGKSDSDPPANPAPNPITNYRVHVTVRNPQQMFVTDADVKTSAGDKPKKVESGWEFDVPIASKPAEGKVTVSASRFDSSLGASLYGQQELVLDKDPNPGIEIQLRQRALSPRAGESSRPPPPHIEGNPPTQRVPSPAIMLYKLHVTVLESEQPLVEGVNIHSLPSGQVKQVSGGWEIDILAANLPADGKVTIYAAKSSAFLKQQVTVSLGTDPNPTVKIPLQSEPSARVSGWVKDSSSKGIAEAVVYECEHRDEAVRTGPDGKFDLMTHKAKGQTVLMCAEKERYLPERQNHPAGTIPMTIILPRSQQ